MPRGVNQLHAVALSEEVTSAKPIGVDLGKQPLALWRDRDGAVHALEDRCPHRRAPLSAASDPMVICGAATMAGRSTGPAR